MKRCMCVCVGGGGGGGGIKRCGGKEVWEVKRWGSLKGDRGVREKALNDAFLGSLSLTYYLISENVGLPF